MSNEAIKKSNRRKLIGLLILMLSPVVLSYALYFSDFKPKSTHYGDLIPLVKMTGTGTNIVSNTILRMKDLHGKWVLVHVDSGVCNDACQKKLYIMRQVRLVQGKEKQRIERLWLINDDVDPDDRLLKDFEGTYFVKSQHSEMLDQIETKDRQTKYIYLIDPMGNLMMRFPEAVDGTKMGQDLKRLLQVSQMEH